MTEEEFDEFEEFDDEEELVAKPIPKKKEVKTQRKPVKQKEPEPTSRFQTVYQQEVSGLYDTVKKRLVYHDIPPGLANVLAEILSRLEAIEGAL